MKFERNPIRELPDGSVSRVYPFHVSLEGLETCILCRDENDYDVFVKAFHICSKRKNVIIVIYAVVSNHGHAVVLAEGQESADGYGEEIKRMYSMYFNRKYGERSVLKHVDSKAIWLNNDWYLRNAIAYDIRNALDNGAESVQTYKWTGYRGAFCHGRVTDGLEVRKVCELKKRERRSIMHTDDDLSKVKWLINEAGELEPASTIDWHYLEAAFFGDQAYFMKSIGTVNTSEMTCSLVVNPRQKLSDSAFLTEVNSISLRWFSSEASSLPIEQKARLIQYVSHCFKTGIPQISRAFVLDRSTVTRLLGKNDS